MCNPDSTTYQKNQIIKINQIKEICLNYSEYYETYYLKTIYMIYNWKLE